jgi:hypothetical protein
MLLSGICPPRMVGQMPTADSFCNTLALFSLNFPCDTLLIPVRHHVTKIEIFFPANALHRVTALEWGTLETGTQHLFQECPAKRLLPYR